MRVALRGAHLRMPEQFADHFQRCATADQQRRESMAQIMNAHTRDPGLSLDLTPEAADFLDRLTRYITGEQPRTALMYGGLPLAHDCGHIRRNRQAVNLALFGGGCGLGPCGKFQIELFKTSAAHLTKAGTCQHTHAYDAGGALVFGLAQRLGQTIDLIHAQIAFTLGLDAPVKPHRGVVGAQFPLDCEVEHLAQNLAGAIGADRRGF